MLQELHKSSKGEGRHGLTIKVWAAVREHRVRLRHLRRGPPHAHTPRRAPARTLPAASPRRAPCPWVQVVEHA